MEDLRNACSVFLEALLRLRLSWKNNIKMNIRETGFEAAEFPRNCDRAEVRGLVRRHSWQQPMWSTGRAFKVQHGYTTVCGCTAIRNRTCLHCVLSTDIRDFAALSNVGGSGGATGA